MTNATRPEFSRRHITIPGKVEKVFQEYATVNQWSLSAFLVKAGIEKISRHRGEWGQKIRAAEGREIDHMTEEKFESMTRAQKWAYVESVR